MLLTHARWFCATAMLAAVTTHSALRAQEVETEVVKPRPSLHVTASSTAEEASIAGQPRLLSDLLDAQVLLQNGDAVGDITDLVLGPRGNIQYAVATYNGRNYLIPYRGMTFNTADHTVQLTLTAEQFEEVQFFDGRNLPNLNSAPVRRQILTLFSGTQAPVVAERDPAVNAPQTATETDRNARERTPDASRDDDVHESNRDRSTRDASRDDENARDDRSPRPREGTRPGEVTPRTPARRTLRPATVGGARVPQPNGTRPDGNAPVESGTPGGSPIQPPAGVTNPGGAPIKPPAGVTNPGGAPIKPPAGVTNPGGAPIKPPPSVSPRFPQQPTPAPKPAPAPKSPGTSGGASVPQG